MKGRGKWNSLATTKIEARYPRTIIPCKPPPTQKGGPLLLSGIGTLQVTEREMADLDGYIVSY